ncbi:MAG: hypothetical protein QM760_21455 [Nibricoccus sp.]
MKLKSLHILLLSALLTALVAGCSSTYVEQSWKSPDVGGFNFKKLLVVAPNPDGANRRAAEDTLKAQLPHIQVVQSYTLLPDKDELKDKAAAGKVIKENGFDGVVIMRMVSKDTELNYMPGAYPAAYGSMWGYWGAGYAMAPYYDTGSITTDKIIGIETNIYDVATEKLVWSGLTKSTNPANAQALVAETVGAIRKEMKKQKLIP